MLLIALSWICDRSWESQHAFCMHFYQSKCAPDFLSTHGLLRWNTLKNKNTFPSSNVMNMGCPSLEIQKRELTNARLSACLFCAAARHRIPPLAAQTTEKLVSLLLAQQKPWGAKEVTRSCEVQPFLSFGSAWARWSMSTLKIMWLWGVPNFRSI